MPTGNLPLPSTEAQRFDLPDAEVRLWPQALPPDDADGWFSALRSRIDWQQEEILIFGERRRVPRLVAWHGDPGTTYTYSGTTHEPLPWPVDVQAIRARVEALSGYRYNSVLLNRYRDAATAWVGTRTTSLNLDSIQSLRRFRSVPAAVSVSGTAGTRTGSSICCCRTAACSAWAAQRSTTGCMRCRRRACRWASAST